MYKYLYIYIIPDNLGNIQKILLNSAVGIRLQLKEDAEMFVVRHPRTIRCRMSLVHLELCCNAISLLPGLYMLSNFYWFDMERKSMPNYGRYTYILNRYI